MGTINFSPREPEIPKDFCRIQFIDFYFPPAFSSLHNIGITATNSEIVSICESATWNRPYEIFVGFKNKFQLYDNISPYDVVQGPLANCYFLACLTSLAKTSSRIQQLFNQNSVSTNGKYEIKCYIRGIKSLINIDDFIPCNKDSEKPIFAKQIGNKIWVNLLEKAWAKHNTCYTNCEYGEEIEAFGFLTGAPSILYCHGSMKITREKMWLNLVDFNKRNYAITCSTKKDQPIEKFNKSGLIQYHVYSILDVQEIILKNNQKLEILLIRDQWQKSHFISQYYSNDLLTDICKNIMKTKYQDFVYDYGTFIIPFEEYFNYFKETTICLYHDLYKHSVIDIYPAESLNLYEFDINEYFKGYICLLQYSKRYKKLLEKNYQYMPIYLILIRKDGNYYKFVNSMISIFNDTAHKEIEFYPGKYFIITGCYYKLFTNPYTVKIYAERKIYFTQKRYDDNNKYLVKACIDYVNFQQEKYEKFALNLVHFKKIDYTLGFGISYIKNTNLTQNIYYEEIIISSGINQIFPKTEINKMSGILKPNDFLINIFEFSSTQGFNYSYKYQCNEIL